MQKARINLAATRLELGSNLAATWHKPGIKLVPSA